METEKGDNTSGGLPLVLWFIVSATLLFALLASICGCATKTRNVELDGLFAQVESATLAVGSVDVMASPVGEESAIVKYGEDTAWLPSIFGKDDVKTHSIRIQLTGTNSTAQVAPIVASICGAFVPTAAIINGGATNAPKEKVEPTEGGK